MTTLPSTETRSRPFFGLGLAALLIGAELLAISLLYQHNFVFTCRAAAPEAFCAFAGRIVPRALAVLAALALFGLARPAVFKLLRDHTGTIGTGLAFNGAGFLLVLLPWGFVSDASSPATVVLAALSWSLGGALAATGLALLLAGRTAWSAIFRQHGTTLAGLLLLAAALPELTDRLQPLWRIEFLTDVTFRAVIWGLELLGYAVQAEASTKLIGADGFFVAVGPQCSGVEGFALITVFLLIYMALFRRDLRFPHVLLLLPLGLLLSWAFNVLRITGLLVLGFEISPDLAIGGFHSHAGWLAFTCLSLLMILVSRMVPAFSAGPAATEHRPLPPFFSDPAVAQILPFIVFMASGLLASTFSETPALLYPLRALALGAILALFLPYLRALPWRFDALAFGSGVGIAALWIATGPDATGPAPFGALSGALLMLWIVARVIGTALFVPLVEELLFRGYLMNRIAPDGGGWRMGLALVVSTALFALLHDRWIAGATAGLIFGLLAWRSRNITDAILSHATANALIAFWALATGAWHIL